MQIPTYTIWDSDEGDSDANPQDNHRLLRLFGQSIEDWPNMVRDQFACFKHTLTTTLCEEIGQALYDSVLDSCRERLCLGKKKHAIKNPRVIQEILKKAQSRGCPSTTLNEIISKIVARTD
ncbi:unnamed protein product [marine sediment metagenome]|uniref:Uncharacterized protein n=1 Tax=marine sediment metagenome TaxID=412755 RepID=X1LSM5_9ZZZZ